MVRARPLRVGFRERLLLLIRMRALNVPVRYARRRTGILLHVQGRAFPFASSST